MGSTQRDSWHVHRHSPSHSSSVQTGSAGSYDGFSQTQVPPMQVFAVQSASDWQAVKLIVHVPSTHLLARQSRSPVHSPAETTQLPVHTPPPPHSLERVHS